MRAEKRIVNAKKELVKLREVAARLHGDATLTKESLESSIPDVQVVTPMSLDEDVDQSSASSRKKAAMQINNQWMNQKRIKSIKGKIKRHNKKKARRVGSASLSSRKTKRSLKR